MLVNNAGTCPFIDVMKLDASYISGINLRVDGGRQAVLRTVLAEAGHCPCRGLNVEGTAVGQELALSASLGACKMPA